MFVLLYWVKWVLCAMLLVDLFFFYLLSSSLPVPGYLICTQLSQDQVVSSPGATLLDPKCPPWDKSFGITILV